MCALLKEFTPSSTLAWCGQGLERESRVVRLRSEEGGKIRDGFRVSAFGLYIDVLLSASHGSKR